MCKYEVGTGQMAAAIRTLPAPSSNIAVATSEGLLRWDITSIYYLPRKTLAQNSFFIEKQKNVSINFS